jgi:hypothetical protein
VRKSYLVRDPVSRERDEGRSFGHYKLVQGIMTPFSICATTAARSPSSSS